MENNEKSNNRSKAIIILFLARNPKKTTSKKTNEKSNCYNCKQNLNLKLEILREKQKSYTHTIRILSRQTLSHAIC